MTQHRSSAAAVVVLALTLGACADAPTKPQSAPEESGAPAVTAATARGSSGMLLQDASARILPSLGEVALRGELEHRLDMLAAALESGDADRIRLQLTLARKVIERQTRAGDVADLASLSLALDQIHLQLDGAAKSEPR